MKLVFALILAVFMVLFSIMFLLGVILLIMERPQAFIAVHLIAGTLALAILIYRLTR